MITLDNQTVEGQNTQQIKEGYYNACMNCVHYNLFIYFYKGVDYLSFLELEQSQQLSKDQDSSSPAITIPTGLPFDNSVQTQAFVSEIV